MIVVSTIGEFKIDDAVGGVLYKGVDIIVANILSSTFQASGKFYVMQFEPVQRKVKFRFRDQPNGSLAVVSVAEHGAQSQCTAYAWKLTLVQFDGTDLVMISIVYLDPGAVFVNQKDDTAVNVTSHRKSISTSLSFLLYLKCPLLV